MAILHLAPARQVEEFTSSRQAIAGRHGFTGKSGLNAKRIILKAQIQISGRPWPTHWLFGREDGHHHSGAIAHDGEKYVAEAPPGGWPFCCPKLHWAIENELSSGDF